MTEETSSVATQRVETVPDQDLRFEIQTLPDCMVEMMAYAGPKLTQEASRKAMDDVAGQVSLPGFRKGKVPPETIQKNFAPSLEKAWKQRLAERIGSFALRLPGIIPVDPHGSVNFAVQKGSPQDGATLRLRFEVIPDITVPDFKSVEVPSCEITDELKAKAEEHMKRSIQLFGAEWDPITDRPVEEGDFVDLDVETQGDTPSPIFQDRRFELNGSIPAWLQRTLIGATLGQVIETVSELDERAAPLAKESFQPTPLKITVRAIQRPRLAEINEALAKQVGAESVEKLLETIHEQSQMLLTQIREGTRIETIRRGLRKILTFPVPRSLVQQEAMHLGIHAIAEMPDAHRSKLTQENVNQLFKSMEELAPHNVRLTILGKKLVDSKLVEFKPAEAEGLLRVLFQEYIKVYGQPKEEQMRPLLEKLQGAALAQALQRVALRWAEAHGTAVQQVHPFIG